MILTRKQTKALDYLEDRVTRDLIFGGGAGGGKSALGAYWILKNCYKYPGSRWLVGRSVLKILKETTLATIFEIAQRQGLKAGIHYNYNAQAGAIQVGESLILLKDLFAYPSDPNFDNLGSLEITGAFIDECNQITSKAKNVVKSRIRYKLTEFNLLPKLLGTCNPSKNWVYSEFYTPYTKNKLPETKKFIQALATDNRHISPYYIENLKTMDANSQERLLHGNWQYDDDPSSLIDIDSINDYFDNSHVQGQGKKYITVDVARLGKDNTVLRLWHGWKVIKRECYGKTKVNETVDITKKMAESAGVPRSQICVDEDGVGGGVKDYLKCKGFVNNSAAIQKGVDKKNKENYENLKSQCSFKIAKRITNKEIYEPCSDSDLRQIITEEMEQVKAKNVDKDAKLGVVPKDIVKEKLGRSPDEWDSIMMREYFELNKFGIAASV